MKEKPKAKVKKLKSRARQKDDKGKLPWTLTKGSFVIQLKKVQ